MLGAESDVNNDAGEGLRHNTGGYAARQVLARSPSRNQSFSAAIVAPGWGLARLCVNPGRRSFLALAWAGLDRAFGPPEVVHFFAVLLTQDASPDISCPLGWQPSSTFGATM
jgi:hypothetical protein